MCFQYTNGFPLKARTDTDLAEVPSISRQNPIDLPPNILSSRRTVVEIIRAVH